MTQRGDSLESLAMRSSEAAIGIQGRMRASSISTTTGLTTRTTTSASADPRHKNLDDGHAHGRLTLGREFPGATAPKARQHAQPKTAVLPTGGTVERGKRITQDNPNITIASPSDKALAKGIESGKYRVETDGLYKRCCRDRDYWPADSEFFYTAKNGTDGLMGFCKACYLEWRYPNGRPSQAERLAA